MLLHIKKQEQSRQLVESAAEVHFDRYAMVPKGPNGTVHMSKHVIYIILVTKLTGEASNHAVLSSPYICMYVCMYVCISASCTMKCYACVCISTTLASVCISTTLVQCLHNNEVKISPEEMTASCLEESSHNK